MAPTLPVDVDGAEYDELRVPTLLKNTPFKKLKRKTGNALPVFLYNSATRFKGHIVVRQCPPVPVKKTISFCLRIYLRLFRHCR